MSIPTPAAATPRPSRPSAPAGTSSRGRHPVVLGAVSGLALYAAFEPAGWWWLAWVALAPLFLLARPDRTARSAYLGAWVGGLVFWLLATNWVREADEGAWPGWIAMALVLSFWWPAFLFLARQAHIRLGLPLMIAAPTAWVAVEFVRGRAPFNGFSWFYLAHSQHHLLPLIQVADLAGAWALSLLIASASAWVVDLLTLPLLRPTPRGARLTRPQVVRAAGLGLALLATLAYGFYRLGSAQFEPGPRLALLQSDIEQSIKMKRDRGEILRTYERLIEQALTQVDRPDLIVWPETSYPSGLILIDPDLGPEELESQVKGYDPKGSVRVVKENRTYIAERLHGQTDRSGVPMLVGVSLYDFRPGGLTRYNSAVLFTPGSRETPAYHKRHLVPFGEYVPLVEAFPWILELTPFDPDNIPSLDPGPVPSPLGLGPWRLAVAICFEDSVPHIARRAFDGVDRQPDVLLNTSNDGWFRGTAAHELHLANSVFRAVELRVPVARAVNTGISALIDGNGRVLEFLPEGREGALTVVAPLDGRTSLYASGGDWLPFTCLAVSLGLAILALGLSVSRSLRSRPGRAPELSEG